MLTIRVRYCGGCNPEIDRSGLIRNLEQGLKAKGAEVVFVNYREAHGDLLILINGCRHACLEEEYSNLEEGVPVLSVKGEMVGNQYMKETDIVPFLVQKILGLLRV
ncbi:MAG: hypothetical protein JRJ75_05255 [Deltaproteobacteria bacterium]|nr:hypothetical protein [Deltaproteobacteria bacterium]MBW1929815.1 hypothetical protein [Deltaproteobacteria bacterium]MBW2024140.1 hypothetical protein [Deltaproteobacteria bacterium]RLB24394.1 MAG: hypothetical protein DRG76_01475 [Deltaproteobacteria bacterium]